MYNPHLWHGAFLLDPEVKKGLTSEIQGMLARTGSFAYRLTKPVVQRTVHIVQSTLSTVGSIAAEPSGLLAALSGSILHGTFSAGGRAARRGRPAAAAGEGGGTGGGAAGGGGGPVAGRASASGAVERALGRAGGAEAWPVLRAQRSLDRAMLLCSAVLEEKLDVLESATSTDRAAAGAAMIAEATAAALAGPSSFTGQGQSSMGASALPPTRSCREALVQEGLVQRRRPKPPLPGEGGDPAAAAGGR
jgi:hypothetical protein